MGQLPFTDDLALPRLECTTEDVEPNYYQEFTDSALSEVSDSDLVAPYPPRCLWDIESLQKFTSICAQTANDTEFDKLNNKLLIALKLFTPQNSIYCSKCKSMTSVTKRGKTNKTYQFACGSHTISASQILESLPESFILDQIPAEPADVFIQTLDWLSKPHLSPELLARASHRNATKRFSFHRSPDRRVLPPGAGKLRNISYEASNELTSLQHRLDAAEASMELLSNQNRMLLESNKALTEELKTIKKFLLENKNNTTAGMKNTQRLEPPSGKTAFEGLPFNVVTQIHRPKVNTKKFYSKAVNASPVDIISPRPLDIKSPTTFSPLTFVFFEGCHRKNASEYRKLMEKCDISQHIARDITFLAEDLLQIITFEDQKENLIKAFTSISPNVKHLNNFNPKLGVSYRKYGNLTDDQAEQAYFMLQSKNVARLEKELKNTPSLKRITGFLRKVIASKSIAYQTPIKPRRIFCLGDFMPMPELLESQTDDHSTDHLETSTSSNDQ